MATGTLRPPRSPRAHARVLQSTVSIGDEMAGPLYQGAPPTSVVQFLHLVDAPWFFTLEQAKVASSLLEFGGLGHIKSKYMHELNKLQQPKAREGAHPLMQAARSTTTRT